MTFLGVFKIPKNTTKYYIQQYFQNIREPSIQMFSLAVTAAKGGVGGGVFGYQNLYDTTQSFDFSL